MNYDTENAMLCYDPLESELGAQSTWCPNFLIGGPVPLTPLPSPNSAAYGPKMTNYSQWALL